MSGDGDLPKSVTATARIAIVATGVSLLFLLPIEVLTVLTVWTVASLPFGVLIGHCVLSGD